MAELAHQALDVGGDHRFVLDDEDIGGQLRIDLRLGFRDQLLDLVEGGVEDLGGLAGREALERSQQEGLARTRRDPHQPMGGVVGLARGVLVIGLQLGPGGAPDGVEHVIERDARRKPVVQRLLARGQGLERDADIVVAGALIAGESARVTADVRQMRRKPLQQAHLPSEVEKSPPGQRRPYGRGSGRQPRKLQKVAV